MPTTKPDTVPQWASTAGTHLLSQQPNRVEPPDAKKQNGLDYKEYPPSNWLNWLFYIIYTWILWLRDFESTAHTWSALQTFSAFPSHGARFLQIPFAEGTSGAWVPVINATGAGASYWTSPGSMQTVAFPVRLHLGDRIASATVYGKDKSSEAFTAYLVYADVDGTPHVIKSQASDGTGTDQTVTLTPASTHTILPGETMYVLITNTGGSTTHRVYGVNVYYDRP